MFKYYFTNTKEAKINFIKEFNFYKSINKNVKILDMGETKILKI